MAQLIFTASVGDLNRLNAAICGLNNYQAIINGVPNPQTPAEFARAWQVREWRRLIVQFEKQAAIRVAVAAVVDPVSPAIT